MPRVLPCTLHPTDTKTIGHNGFSGSWGPPTREDFRCHWMVSAPRLCSDRAPHVMGARRQAELLPTAAPGRGPPQGVALLASSSCAPDRPQAILQRLRVCFEPAPVWLLCMALRQSRSPVLKQCGTALSFSTGQSARASLRR